MLRYIPIYSIMRLSKQVHTWQGGAAAIKEVAEAKKVAIETVKVALGTAELTTQFLIASDCQNDLKALSRSLKAC